MSDRLRILRISHSAVVPEYRERDRALLRRFPVDVELIMPVHWEHIGLVGAQDTVAEPFQIRRAATLGSGSVPLFAFDPLPIIRALKEFRPHVVDVHEEPYSVSGFECVYLTKLVAPGSGCVFYSAQNINKQYPPPFSWTEKFVYRNVQAAYPCSQGVADVLRAKGFVKPIHVIPLGLDPTVFRSQREGARGADRFRIGYAGRLTSSKGISVLLSALAMLPPDVQYELKIAGSGPEESSLRQQADSLNIGHHIRWHGELPLSAMPQFYRECDFFVVPSLTTARWKEQFGRVAAEAMAAGCVVIASDSGSLPEVVADSGLVVPEGNAEALSDAITMLARQPEYRLRLSAAGEHRARSCYTWDQVAELMYDMYCSVIPPQLVPT